MKTIPEIINLAASDYYPGTSFSVDVLKNAAELLENDAHSRALRALRKAVLQFRPATAKLMSKTTVPTPATAITTKP